MSHSELRRLALKPHRIFPEPKGALRAERYLLHGRPLRMLGELELTPAPRPVSSAPVALAVAIATAVVWFVLFCLAVMP